MSTALFPTNSLNKASGLLLLLICISMGHAHFLDDEIHEPMRPTMVFFSCSTPEKCSGKATHKVSRDAIYTWFLNSEKKLPSSQSKHSNPYVCSFSTGNVKQAAAYPKVYPTTLKSRARYNYATHLFQYVGALWFVCFDESRTHERWPR